MKIGVRSKLNSKIRYIRLKFYFYYFIYMTLHPCFTHGVDIVIELMSC